MVSGATLWRGGRDAGATRQFTDMTRAFPTQVRVLDMNGDSFADRMYAADISGQIWRFDIKANQTPADTVNGGVIARLGAEGLANPTAADTRRFYNTPDVSVFRDPITGTRVMSLAIGSGYRASPFDVTATDRFYSIRDKSVFGQLEQPAYDGYTVITEGDLVEVSGSVKKVVGSSDKGWKFTLPPNEKVVSNSITFKNEIIFVSLDPRSVSGAACGAGQGTNYRYRVSVINGDPIVNNLDSITPGLEDEARRERLPQGGILPPPTVIFPSPDANCTGPACNPPPLVCIGVLCDDPYPSRPPKRTLWTEDGIE
jgi:type IV pilus assembly protein PilY1